MRAFRRFTGRCNPIGLSSLGHYGTSFSSVSNLMGSPQIKSEQMLGHMLTTLQNNQDILEVQQGSRTLASKGESYCHSVAVEYHKRVPGDPCGISATK